jgi:cytochrome c5
MASAAPWQGPSLGNASIFLYNNGDDMKHAIISAMGLAMLFGIGQVAAAADGKAVYDKSCAACHKSGAMKAPKTGDAAACDTLKKAGLDGLTASVIKGKGVMPPKGGAASDADAKVAVEYILAQCK